MACHNNHNAGVDVVDSWTRTIVLRHEPDWDDYNNRVLALALLDSQSRLMALFADQKVYV